MTTNKGYDARTGMTTNKGIDPMTGLYTTRYYARKAATGSEVVVKVCGGYTIMTASNYNIWRKQR